MKVISKNLTPEKSTMLKWFLQCKVLQNHVITGTFGIPNRLCNIPVEDLGCLTYLLQNMAKIVQEEIANESKLVKVLLQLGTGGHLDRSSWSLNKAFGQSKCCYDGQWPLTSYFKPCKTTPTLRFFAGFQWNMLADSININNYN